MNITKGNLRKDFSRELYWARFSFVSDDGLEKTKVLACASHEYLFDLYKLPGDQQLSTEQTDIWQESVITKWSKLGNELFLKDTHYDVYANTPEGEANGIDFLLKNSKVKHA